MNGLSSPVILVIESQPHALAITTGILSAHGYQIHAASDQATARALCETVSVDLVICDVNLNGEDGVEFGRQLRQLESCRDVPIMFLSSTQIPSVASRIFDNGTALFLKKPFAANVLLDLVDKSLWMPHLIKSHINRPHIPMRTMDFSSPTSVSTPSAR